jgi:hypothetical protein
LGLALSRKQKRPLQVGQEPTEARLLELSLSRIPLILLALLKKASQLFQEIPANWPFSVELFAKPHRAVVNVWFMPPLIAVLAMIPDGLPFSAAVPTTILV